MSRTYTAYHFLAHLIKSKRWDSFHSPFLFRLFTTCCDDSILFPFFGAIERYRRELISSDEVIQSTDFGAGSFSEQDSKAKRISSIAGNAVSLGFQCRFMSRLARQLKPNRIVEFGTSLGVSAAYLAAGAPDALIDTVEGDPAIAERALKFFEKMTPHGIILHNSSFSSFLDGPALRDAKIDLLFLDGHHTSTAMLMYYKAIKDYFTRDTVVIIDDIYWSADMQSGWKKLIALPEVTQSVDCFHFGLLFYSADFMHKENHIIRLPLRMQYRE